MSHRYQLKTVADTIKNSSSLVLTTHRYCDGDGLGALLSIYHGLQKINKNVRVITVDQVPQKYYFLSPEKHTESFDNLKTPIQPHDLTLIFDTNDSRLIQPLYDKLQLASRQIIFIDHHPILTTGPKPAVGSIVDTGSASTGEICYFLLKAMDIAFDAPIATALYTSILFDTQRFQFIKNSAMSYKICAEIYPYISDNNLIYSQLFDIQSKEKMNMLAKAIHKIEYLHQDKVAVLTVSKQEMAEHQLSIADACDFIDITLGVATVELAILIVHIANGDYKLSFRSKTLDVSKLAEKFNGGGHKNASGAILTNCIQNPKNDILKVVKDLFFISF